MLYCILMCFLTVLKVSVNLNNDLCNGSQGVGKIVLNKCPAYELTEGYLETPNSWTDLVYLLHSL